MQHDLKVGGSDLELERIEMPGIVDRLSFGVDQRGACCERNGLYEHAQNGTEGALLLVAGRVAAHGRRTHGDARRTGPKAPLWTSWRARAGRRLRGARERAVAFGLSCHSESEVFGSDLGKESVGIPFDLDIDFFVHARREVVRELASAQIVDLQARNAPGAFRGSPRPLDTA